MKKIIISILALLLIWVSSAIVASGDPFDYNPSKQITFDRNEFERRMYVRSGGILPKDEYTKLINPFLNQAEQELKCVQFCEKNKADQECQNYFEVLLNYNVACFHDYALGNSDTKSSFELQEKRLTSCIEALALKGALQSDEITNELNKTKKLFLGGNKTFYAASPSYIKFALWCSAPKITPRIIGTISFVFLCWLALTKLR